MNLPVGQNVLDVRQTTVRCSMMAWQLPKVFYGHDVMYVLLVLPPLVSWRRRVTRHEHIAQSGPGNNAMKIHSYQSSILLVR